jgi:spermidine/putrescine-binding protein
MKKFIVIITALLVFLLLLTACSQATPEPAAEPAVQEAEGGGEAEAPAAGEEMAAVEPASEIVVYNWSEYIDPDLYTLFTDQTGISVVEDNFSSNEELLAKLQGGSAGYAIIVPSDYMVNIMIEEGMLAELDHANIPNLGNLSEMFTTMEYDPGNKYCVAYDWGTTGIGYLASQVDEPTSWAVFFDPDPNAAYYGRYTMLDDVREAFAAALTYLGYDINTQDEAQLEEAKALLIKAKAGLAGYDSDTYEDLVASEENLMAHGWNGDFLVAMEDNEDIAYTVPQEGGVLWVDNMCIPASATPEQKLAGEMFINFMLEPEMGAKLTEFNWYASPNAAAEEFIDPDILEDPAVYPPPEVMAKLHTIRPVGEFESVYQRMWDEVKSAAAP